MPSGILLNGTTRPKSKKAVKEAVAADPSQVYVEDTSMFPGGFSGTVDQMPEGRIDFVGPDPYTKRNFFGNLRRNGSKITVT